MRERREDDDGGDDGDEDDDVVVACACACAQRRRIFHTCVCVCVGGCSVPLSSVVKKWPEKYMNITVIPLMRANGCKNYNCRFIK